MGDAACVRLAAGDATAMILHGGMGGGGSRHGGKAARQRVPWSTAWREARALIHQHRHRLSLGLGLLAANRAASLVLPASAGWLVDRVVGQGQHQLIWPIAGAVVAATAVQAASGYGLAQILGIAGQQAINDLRAQVHRHVLSLPVSRFDAAQSGQLISRIMSDAEGVRNLVGTGIVQLVGGLLTAVVVLVILCLLNWHLTVAIGMLLAVFGVTAAATFKRLRPLFRERQQRMGEISGWLGQVLAGVRVVKVATAEPRMQERFERDTAGVFDLIKRSMSGVAGVTALTVLLLGLAGAVFIVVGGWAMAGHRMTVGEFLQYVLFVGLLAAPVTQIAAIGTQVSEAFAGLDRIRELLRQPAEASGLQPVSRLAGRVEFQGVSFAYQPGRLVLEGIDLLAEAGQTVALVGPSGSGKSTLAALVLAFHRPEAGRILVDGLDLADLDLRGYRAQLGVVLQDNWLLDATVLDNLRFANPEATEVQVREALRASAAEGFVDALPQGLQTVVGERGVRLSGGQRQRIAIARALLADPRILVLDEATSALDSDSEAEIQAALQRLRAGRTTFVIAHRLSTIRDAHRIVVLDGGRLVEQGTHAQLLERAGLYRRLHDRQAGVAADRHINPGEELKPVL